MISLFSSFDSYYFFYSFARFLSFSLILSHTLSLTNCISLSASLLNIRLIKILSFSSKLKFFDIFIIFLFWVLFLLNLLSVGPFNYCFTSQIRLPLFVRFSLWFIVVCCSLILNFKRFLSHFIPEGTPFGLVPLIFVIELVRNLIRPITLAVRLLANILAGHLLIILLRKLVFLSNYVFSFYILLELIESFVSLIQSFIFCTLISIYYSEI